MGDKHRAGDEHKGWERKSVERISGEGIGGDVSGGCLECVQLEEAYRKTTLELGMHHDEHDSCGGGGVKDIAYIHKEAELYEANNKARRAFNDHREKVHEGMAYA